MAENSILWTERHRPQTMDDFVWNDADQRRKVEEWIKMGYIPSHLLLSGSAGIGKTSLCKLILRELKIPASDIMEINASRERKVDEIQSRWAGFVNTWAMGDTGIKYIIFDECDALSPLSQRMLRGDMESYSDIVRVLFTCNYPQKVIEPLRNRCQTMSLEALNRDEFLSRMVQILDSEQVDFIDDDGGIETLDTYVARSYPSLRKCINLVQENIVDGKLMPPKAETDTDKDYVIEMLSLFASGEYTKARQIIISQAQPEEYPDLYRYFYQNLHLFGDSRSQQEEALIRIRDAIYYHNMVADQEINLAACISELTSIASRV